MTQISLNWEPERKTFSVSELTAAIRHTLASRFDDIWVAGEVSAVRLASSGHYYFMLKDETAQLRCVCFRMNARLLKVKPQDGMAVVLRGRMEVYEARGEYQLLVSDLQPQGYGALQLAFEQLKRRLAAEGLFDASRKRPLPVLPRRIGIVTSPSGAAIRDMIQILSRRFPGIHIRLFPAQVQGAGSVEAVVAGLEYFGASGWPDVVIVGRGGGSVEDLWTFNEEAVARAIAACPVPVISAVGHETDFTIADFVADLRAPTPSAAAELVVRPRQDWLDQLGAARERLLQAARYRLAGASAALARCGVDRAASSLRRRLGRLQQRLDDCQERLAGAMRRHIRAAQRRWQEVDNRLRRRDLRLLLVESARRLEAAESALRQALQRRLDAYRRRLERASARLEQLSPLRVLERGYAIVRDPATGQVLRDSRQAPPGTPLDVRLWKGSLKVRVTGPELR